MVVRVCVDIAHGMYLTVLIVIRPSVESAPFPRGVKRVIMVVRVSYCRWYVSCESPHIMFLVCVA